LFQMRLHMVHQLKESSGLEKVLKVGILKAVIQAYKQIDKG